MRFPWRSCVLSAVLVGAVVARAGASTPHPWARAAGRALRDPHTWAPVAAAAGIAALGDDRRITRWAFEHHPVFGSPHEADHASDELRALSEVGMVVTALAAPRDGDGPAGSRWMRLLADEGAATGTKVVTGVVKHAAARQRPNGHDNQSMPSAHASFASAYDVLSRRNLLRMDLPRGARWACDAGVDVTAGLTGWARLEAGVHYPTDVLVGAALGNFVTGFLEEGMLGRPAAARVAFVPERSGMAVAGAWSWGAHGRATERPACAPDRVALR